MKANNQQRRDSLHLFHGKAWQVLVFLLTVLLAFPSCSDDDDKVVLGAKPGSGGTLPYTAGSFAQRLEVPALESGNIFVQHSTLYGRDSVMTFCLEFNPATNHSRWVAFRFDAITRLHPKSRVDAWADDPKLPASMRVGSGKFSSNSRGHLCASADRLYSTEANRQTFYMSNMSPQTSDFNEGIWRQLEDHVRDELGRSASFADTLYVVKGGTIGAGQTKGKVTGSAGLSIVVPRYYFMALLKVKNGAYSAIGFWLEHKYYDIKTPLSEFAVSIDELESQTKIDFFHNLPDVVERSVESVCLPGGWKL